MKKKVLSILITLLALCTCIFTLTACGENETPHTHNYAILKYDNDNHWFECECQEKNSIDVHNIINGQCVCGYIMPHTHDYTVLKNNLTQHWYECSCGAFETKENHKGGTPTETSKAVCSICNQEYGSILGHMHSYNSTITSPKCGKQGYTTYLCVCGDYYIDDYVDALTHCYTNYIYNNDAKCEVDGTKTATCDNACGTKDTITATGTALEHIFTNYRSDKNATYESDGTKTATCNRGCGKTDTLADVGSMLVENEIRFNTLTVDGTSVYGKVSNATTDFVFYEEIFVSGTATYVVDDDKDCSSPIKSKVVDLAVGDNTFYVLESVGNDVKLYTVVIRRRPMHTITFNTDGGTIVQSQTIEEDDFATVPITTKMGYTFSGWDYNFNTPITSNKTIIANWTPNTNTPYKVEYYLENLEDDNYTLQTFENKTGTTDTIAIANIKTFDHFTYKQSSTDSGNIAPNGSTILKVYYIRNKCTVTFDGNGGTLVRGNAIQTVKYGGSVTAPIFEKEGHSFISFDKTNYSNINESFTTTATWKVNQYSITLVYGNGQEDKVIIQNYNTAITEVLPTTLERAGYTFNGWDETMPTVMQCYNITITAKWQTIFNVSSGEIISVTSFGKTLSEIVIPENIDGVTITTIGRSAFSCCTSLKSIEIPNSVISIGDYAFEECTSLTIVMIGNGIKNIGDYAFLGCDELKYNVEGELKYLGNTDNSCLYLWGPTSKSIKSVTINVNCKVVSQYAFSNCKSLESIEMPNSVTSIGCGAFYSCSSLANVYYEGTINEWVDIEFFDGHANPLSNYGAVLYINGAQQIDITISAENIRNYAFYKYSSLINVTITSSVKNIGAYSFYYCKILDINIDNSLETIGNYAFYACNFENIIFNGSTAEFDCIKKEDVWYHGFVEIIVQCTDGRILISK